jgi:hypothetical protein
LSRYLPSDVFLGLRVDFAKVLAEVGRDLAGQENLSPDTPVRTPAGEIIPLICALCQELRRSALALLYQDLEGCLLGALHEFGELVLDSNLVKPQDKKARARVLAKLQQVPDGRYAPIMNSIWLPFKGAVVGDCPGTYCPTVVGLPFPPDLSPVPEVPAVAPTLCWTQEELERDLLHLYDEPAQVHQAVGAVPCAVRVPFDVAVTRFSPVPQSPEAIFLTKLVKKYSRIVRDRFKWVQFA